MEKCEGKGRDGKEEKRNEREVNGRKWKDNFISDHAGTEI